MAERKSFLVYRDWEDFFTPLSAEQVGYLFLAIFAYVNRGQRYEGNDPMVTIAFSVARNTIDRDGEKYRKRCEQNSKNARKRGHTQGEADSEEADAAEGNQGISKKADAAERSQPVAEEANASERCQTQANEADKEKDKDKDKEKDREKEKDRDREKDKDAFLAAAGPAPAEPEAAAEQKNFCLAGDENGGRHEPQKAAPSPLRPAHSEPQTAPEDDKGGDFAWLADRCRAVTGISPDRAQQTLLSGWYQAHGEATLERLFDEARTHNAQRFGYLSAVMRRWEKTGVPGGQAKPRRGPEPQRTPSPEQAARQQAALEENQRQLEKLLADTAWVEDKWGA